MTEQENDNGGDNIIKWEINQRNSACLWAADNEDYYDDDIDADDDDDDYDDDDDDDDGDKEAEKDIGCHMASRCHPCHTCLFVSFFVAHDGDDDKE